MNVAETFAEAMRPFELIHERPSVLADHADTFAHLAFKFLQVGSLGIDLRVWLSVTQL